MADDPRLKIIVDIREAVQKLDQLEGELGEVDDSAAQVAAGAGPLGQAIAAAFIAATAAAVGYVKVLKETISEYAVQEEAVAQLEAALRSTGEGAGFTSEELQKVAGELQGITRFGDEDIVRMQSQLLTFTSITGEAFTRTTEAVLNLSARMNQDLQTSVVQLGKALNDPVSNLGALGRAGIQFNDAQTEMIKKFAETGELAKAQTIILDELETQFGGAAKAAGETFAGELDKLTNAFSDLKEEIGAGAAPAVVEVLLEIRDVIEELIELGEPLGRALAEPIAEYAEELRIARLTLDLFRDTGESLTEKLAKLDEEIENGLDSVEKQQRAMERAREAMEAARAAAEERAEAEREAAEATTESTEATDEAADSFDEFVKESDKVAESLREQAAEEEKLTELREAGIKEAEAAAEAATGIVEAQKRLNEIYGETVEQEEEVIESREDLTETTRELTEAEKELQRARDQAEGLEQERRDIEETIRLLEDKAILSQEEQQALNQARERAFDLEQDIADAQNEQADAAERARQEQEQLSEERAKGAEGIRQETEAIKEQIDALKERSDELERFKRVADDAVIAVNALTDSLNEALAACEALNACLGSGGGGSSAGPTSTTPPPAGGGDN